MEKQELIQVMGKSKKPVKRTKELSVAIAESSSLDAAVEGQLPLTPRKRGRPRKIVIVEKTDDLAEAKDDEDGENKSKNARIQEAEKPEQEQEEEEEVSTKRQLPARSRARRKGKPRKSS